LSFFDVSFLEILFGKPEKLSKANIFFFESNANTVSEKPTPTPHSTITPSLGDLFRRSDRQTIFFKMFRFMIKFMIIIFNLFINIFNHYF